MTPDVNILVAASRIDHPHHIAALSWLPELGSQRIILRSSIGYNAGF